MAIISHSQWKNFLENKWRKDGRRLVYELNELTRSIDRKPPLSEPHLVALTLQFEDLRSLLRKMEEHLSCIETKGYDNVN
jgi:hypothetical protein